VHERRRAGDEMLAVVHDNESRRCLQVTGQRFYRIPAGQDPDPEHGGDGICDQAFVGQRRQLRPPDPAPIPVQDAASDPLGEARLSAAACPCEGEEPGLGEQRHAPADVAIAADER
jgi:hypothetical protein